MFDYSGYLLPQLKQCCSAVHLALRLHQKIADMYCLFIHVQSLGGNLYTQTYSTIKLDEQVNRRGLKIITVDC